MEMISFENFLEIPLDVIDEDPKQPRRFIKESELTELRDSIKKIGITTPITVRKSEFDGRYILVTGERRLQASKNADKETIPAVIKEVTDPLDILSIQIAENLDRENLNPLDLARSLQTMVEFFKERGLEQNDVADRLGKSKDFSKLPVRQ